MAEVFLDTNFIMATSYFRSTLAHGFLKAAKLLDIKVVIPEIVIDETKANFLLALKEKAQAYQKASENLRLLLHTKFPPIDVDKHNKKFNEEFDSLLEDYNVIIVSYPDIKMKELVGKSYTRKKPFKPSGEGHKDFIIWESIKNYWQKENLTAGSFLTGNIHDFCEVPDKEPVLHSELCADLGIENTAMPIFVSLKKYFESQLAPSISVEPKYIPDLNIANLTQNYLEESLDGYAADAFEGIPFGDITISSIGEIETLSISLSELDADEILISVSGNVEIEAEGFIEKWEFVSLSEDGGAEDVYVSNSDWNDHVMSVSTSIYTPFELTMSYSKQEKIITSQNLDLPNEISNDYYQ